ncbi:cadherin EGF LAG seven-pass G-type receptor 1-like [Amphiura filiformis]|uniref:cadherin EGF LAG seven-pass G-type receptor 1-like n=1 Tax=Amphiura filiformis TaxID=82378 RepID=UPI003B21D0D1
MLSNSISLHLVTKMRVDVFVKSKTFEAFLELLASVLDTEVEDVFIVGLFDEIHPYMPPAINLTLAALKRNGDYFTAAELRARISLEQSRLWQIAAVLPPVDKLCAYETCDPWPNCKGVPAYKRNVPTVISPTYSFMSVKWDRQYHCICPPAYSGRRCNQYYDFCNEDPCQRYGKCRTTEQGPYCECEPGFVGDFCEIDMRFARCPEKNVCQHNGTCVESDDTYGGFYCDCPDRVDGMGTFCEGITRTFISEGSFMAFDELGWHDQLNIKLSFRTYRSNGLILYNARSNRRQHDFIALEVVNKQLVFSFSLGELYSKVHAGLYGGISNGEWHDVQINFVRQHVLVGVDSCINWVETLEPDEYLQWNIGNHTCLGYAAQFGGFSNHSVNLTSEESVNLTSEELCDIDINNFTCLGYGSQFGGYYDWRFLDLDGPLFLGAAQNYWFGLAVENKNFVGCIRDVFIDYQQLDLNGYIKENSTKLGCDLRFNDPCSDGQCNLADDPIHIGPVKILKTRSWEKAIQIIWKPPRDSPVPIEGYEVSYTEVYNGVPSDWRNADVPETNSKKKKRRVKFRKLEPNTLYIFAIKAYGQGLFGEEVRLNRTTYIPIQ